jgi:hypothetical protein
MSDQATSIPTLAAYDEKAAILLAAYNSGTPEAMERLYQHTWHRRTWPTMRTYVQLDLGKRPLQPGGDVPITLDDARYLIAREHGFEGWPELDAFTRSPPPRPLARPIRIVEASPGGAKTFGRFRDLDALVEWLAAHPGLGLAAEGQVTDATLAEIASVGALRSLDLSGSRALTDDGLTHLSRLPELEHLNLGGTTISGAGLRVLRTLPALRSLSLAWTGVSDDSLKALAACERLERVDLVGTGAGSIALRALAGKPALASLAIALGDEHVALLREIPRFAHWQSDGAAVPPSTVFQLDGAPTHLTLRGPVTDRGLAALHGLEGLASLNIDDARLSISAAGLEPLTRLPHLSELRADAKDDWMPVIARMPHLRFLGVQDTTATDAGFAALSRSSSIAYIWGRRCHGLERRGFHALATMPALRGLSVSCLNVDETGLSALPSFPSLVELMPMDVPDEGYRHVAACRRLESLILMYCRETTDRATEHIASLPALTYYFNSYTTITDRTPQLLSRLESLERVTFDMCHALTDTGVSALARLPRLRALRASGRGLTREVCRAFGDGVEVSVEP